MATNTDNATYCITPIRVSFNKGDETTLEIIPTPSEKAEIKWSSKWPANVSCEAEQDAPYKAKIKGLTVKSSSYITATLNGVNLDSCYVQVNEVCVEKIVLADRLTLCAGEKQQINATIYPKNATEQGIIWASNDTEVATVNNGLIEVKKSGFAIISATTIGTDKHGQQLTAYCTLNINDIVTKEDLLALADKYATRITDEKRSIYSLTLKGKKIDDKKAAVEEKITLLQGSLQTKNDDGKDLTNSLLLASLSYHKEIYRPGCLELIIETNAGLSYFSELVTLKYNVYDKDAQKYTENSVASNYYIFEKKKKAGYVTLKAYSVDKFLTIDLFCQAFTGQKLVEEIIATTLTDCKGNLSLFCKYITSNNDLKKKEDYTLPLLCKYVFPNLKQLYIPNTIASSEYCIKDGKKQELKNNNKPAGACSYYEVEPLIPYCVQYNESFYDFLVRICNRNGEFLFCEDNKLYVGLPTTTPVAISEYDDSGKKTGYDIEYNENYKGISNTAKNIMPNSLNKSKYCPQSEKANELQSNGSIYPEEYNTEISDPFIEISDIMLPTSTVVNALKNIANSRTVYDGITTTVVGSAMTSTLYNMALEKQKTKFDSFYDNIKYQFSTNNKLLNETFYQNILENEENACSGKVVVTGTSCKNHKLGDTITIGGYKYVVWQIRGMAKNIDGLIQSKNIERYIEKFEMVLLPYADSDMAYPFPLLKNRVRTAMPQRAKVLSNFDPERLGRVRISYPWQYKNSLPSPWVRTSYPMASDGSGFMFIPQEGDEVLVDYENGNVERPFVVGSLYNKNTKPSWHAKSYGSSVKSITSANGHHISFTDLPGSRFVANLFPFTTFMEKFCLFDFNNKDSFHQGDGKYLGGGFEIADQCGLYSIKGSTDSRNITISSPLGDIKLDAYSGITINAPCGDVNIIGKNVKIEAKNNLSLISGSNISTPYWYHPNDQKIPYWSNVVIGLLTTVTKTLSIDLSLIRTWFETIFRPIGGTMLIKSARYMCIEAGNGKAFPDKLPIRQYSKDEVSQGLFLNQSLQTRANQQNAYLTDNGNIVLTRIAYLNVYKCCSFYNKIINNINTFRDTYRAIVGDGDMQILANDFTNVLTHNLTNGTNDGINAHLDNRFPIPTNTSEATNAADRENRKSALVRAHGTFNSIKNDIDLFRKFKERIANATAQGVFTAEDSLNIFKEHPGNNIEEQLNGPVNRDTLKEMLFKEFKNLDIPGVRFADQYANNAVAETLITVLNAPQLQEPQFGDAMEKSWPIIFGMKSFLDDNMWSIADEGGILISAQKGRKFKLGKDGLLVEKNNIAQVVNTMRSYITSAII